MARPKIVVFGAGGETGRLIVEALKEDGHFDIICAVRDVSPEKPAVKSLHELGLEVIRADPSNDSLEDLASLMRGAEVVLVCVNVFHISIQIRLIDAASQAGVQRFIPTNWGTPSPRGGIMDMRDEKEAIHDHIFRHGLGFTIIDVGNWYEVSFPRVPSGRFDYAAFDPSNEVYCGGDMPNMLMGQRDVGRITAQIVKDPRTLNKRVYAYGEILSQNDLYKIIEQKTGEKLKLDPISPDDIRERVAAAREAFEASPNDWLLQVQLCQALYLPSKYIRGDNTPKCAEYLGYISARTLYPDYKYQSFEDFVDILLTGSVKKPYT